MSLGGLVSKVAGPPYGFLPVAISPGNPGPLSAVWSGFGVWLTRDVYRGMRERETCCARPGV